MAFYLDRNLSFDMMKSDRQLFLAGIKSTTLRKQHWTLMLICSEELTSRMRQSERTWRRICLIFHLSASVNKVLQLFSFFAFPRGLTGSSHWRKTLLVVTPQWPSLRTASGDPALPKKKIKPEALSSSTAVRHESRKKSLVKCDTIGRLMCDKKPGCWGLGRGVELRLFGFVSAPFDHKTPLTASLSLLLPFPAVDTVINLHLKMF